MAGFTFARRRSAIICKVTVNSMCGNVTDLQIALRSEKMTVNAKIYASRLNHSEIATRTPQLCWINFYTSTLHHVWVIRVANKRPMSGGCLVKTTQCLDLVMQLHTITCKYDEIQMLFRENIYVAVRICITDVRLSKENTKQLGDDK